VRCGAVQCSEGRMQQQEAANVAVAVAGCTRPREGEGTNYWAQRHKRAPSSLHQLHDLQLRAWRETPTQQARK
jgi:hypothetical protein